MNFVIDANIIFSSLMSGKTFYMDFLNKNEAYAPDFLFEEIDEQENIIINKTPLKEEFYKYALEIFKYLTIIPKIAIKPETWQKAYNLCKEIDEKDTAYVALSMELDFLLITRDKKLYKGLQENGFDNVILFSQFLEQYKG